MGADKTKTIDNHKGKRIDAQYYIKVDQENKIKAMLQEAKIFVSNFDELVSNLFEEDIKLYRDKIAGSKNNSASSPTVKGRGF